MQDHKYDADGSAWFIQYICDTFVFIRAIDNYRALERCVRTKHEISKNLKV